MLTAPILFILAATWFLYNQIVSFKRAKLSESWPTAKGVIKYAQRQFLSIDDYANLTGVKVIYEYRVQKETHTAQTMAFSPKFSSPRRLLVQYKPGKHVPVFYNPAHPEMASLERGVQFGNYIMVSTGGIVLLLAILYLLQQLP
jgi:hypothetical protein